MGLFDGTIRSFATKLTTYLEDRSVTLVAAGRDHQAAGEQYEAMRNFIVADALVEMSKAITYVARD